MAKEYNRFNDDNGNSRTLIEFVDQELDGTDWDHGALERVEKTTDNVKEALSRLLSVLVEQQHLKESDVYYIVKGHEP